MLHSFALLALQLVLASEMRALATEAGASANEATEAVLETFR